MRHCWSAALLLLIGSLCGLDRVEGQVKIGPKGPVGWNEPRDNPPVSLTLTAAAEPTPALKYSFLPSPYELKPGNAAPHYFRALLLFHAFRATKSGNYDAELMKWAYDRTTQVPAEKVRNFLAGAKDVLAELSVAAAKESCRWDLGLDRLEGPEAIAYVPIEFREMQDLARLLTIKVRYEISERRFDDALATLRVGYRLASDIAQEKTALNGLNAGGVANLMTTQVQVLIACPDAPNLYWALTELPTPFIDYHAILRHEMTLAMRVFPFLQDAETAQRSPEEWEQLLKDAADQVHKLRGNDNFVERPDDLTAEERARLSFSAIADLVPQAKAELLKQGLAPSVLEKMPPGQIVAAHVARVQREIFDDYLKNSLLPYLDAAPRMRATEERLRDKGFFYSSERPRRWNPIGELFHPSVAQEVEWHVGLERKVKALRVIEAIRMHASQGAGRLPQSLDEITIVPVPKDPFTNAPYPYECDGTKALLTAGGRFAPDAKFEITLSTGP